MVPHPSVHLSRKFQVGLSVLVLGVFLDQTTKYWARNQLAHRPVLIGDTHVGFELAHNSGIAFSLFKGSTALVTLFALLVIAVLVFAYFRTRNSRDQYAYLVIAVGALGNICDRFFQPPYNARGYVTDFIRVGSWPIFNLADTFITLGAAALVVFSLFSFRKGA